MAYNNPVPNMLNVAPNRVVIHPEPRNSINSFNAYANSAYASNDNISPSAVTLGDMYGVSQADMIWSVFCIPQYLKGSSVMTIPTNIVVKLSAQALTRLQTKYTIEYKQNCVLVYYPRLDVMIMAQPMFFANKHLQPLIPGMGPGGAVNLRWFDMYTVNTPVPSPAEIQAATRRLLPPQSPPPADFKVPRPRNAWIIFRQAHHKQAAEQNPGKTNNELSTILSNIWQTMPAKDRDVWITKGIEEKAEHARRYPNYVYQPRRPSEKKKRWSKKKAAAAAAAAAAATAAAAQGPAPADNPSQEPFRASDLDSIAPSEEWMGAYEFRFTQEEIDMMVPDFAFD